MIILLCGLVNLRSVIYKVPSGDIVRIAIPVLVFTIRSRFLRISVNAVLYEGQLRIHAGIQYGDCRPLPCIWGAIFPELT